MGRLVGAPTEEPRPSKQSQPLSSPHENCARRCPPPEQTPKRLPTDDHAYEARKEREAEMEEERRGAAAAVSHKEFMYI